jgi:hypothetical protein
MQFGSVLNSSFCFLCSAIRFCLADLFFMVSEQAADPASVQLAELRNVFQQAL